MRPWLRLLIVLLMALALPVQGLAAATMAHCGPSHERMHLPRALADEGLHALHGPGDQDLVAHDQGHDHEQHDDGRPGKLTELGKYKLGKYKCGSCASCCTGVALISSLPRVPEPGQSHTVFVVDTVDITAVPHPGPDRPPRIALA